MTTWWSVLLSPSFCRALQAQWVTLLNNLSQVCESQRREKSISSYNFEKVTDFIEWVLYFKMVWSYDGWVSVFGRCQVPIDFYWTSFFILLLLSLGLYFLNAQLCCSTTDFCYDFVVIWDFVFDYLCSERKRKIFICASISTSVRIWSQRSSVPWRFPVSSSIWSTKAI